MLRTNIAILFGLFPAHAVGQVITATAKCIAGYEWTFNTINQSPCDVAASLAAVCTSTGTFNISPLSSGYVYASPTKTNANSCTCNSVYYSMLSACGYCQRSSYHSWSVYKTNCSEVYSQSFPRQIPVGVKVPSWAYLNVTDGDNFNVTRAQQTKGTESTRISVSSSTFSSTNVSSTSKANAGTIAGGVVGGVIGIALIGGLIVFLLVRKKRSSKPPSALATQGQSMGYTPYTNSVHALSSNLALGRLYKPSDPTTFPIAEHPAGGYDYLGHSPFMQNLTPNYTGGSDHGLIPPSGTLSPMRPEQTVMPSARNTARPQYSGAPEV